MKPVVICLCPVRNEAWILDRFLSAASVWADHIVVLDQASTDETEQIVKRYSKARYILKKETDFDETQRREELLAAGRAVTDQQRLFVALDADEFLAADFLEHPEWETLLSSPPGTTALCRWVNLYDGMRRAHICDFNHLLAYMDDGRGMDNYFIHGPRLPIHPKGPHLQLNFGKVLHHQYLNWERMKSKHRWYQCLETLRFPRKSAIGIYRQYHHMDVPCSRYDPVCRSWFEGYERKGVDIHSFSADPVPWFDTEVLQFFQQHGTSRFSKLAIWDTDWIALAKAHRLEKPEHFADPRSNFEKRVHRWLAASQDPRVIFHLKNRLISLFLRHVLRGW